MEVLSLIVRSCCNSYCTITHYHLFAQVTALGGSTEQKINEDYNKSNDQARTINYHHQRQQEQ